MRLIDEEYLWTKRKIWTFWWIVNRKNKMHQKACEIIERFLFKMLSRRYAHIESNVVVIIELRLITNFHAKIAEKINSKWDCSFQSVWLQNVFTSQRNKCAQKKWKDKISNIHRIFDKIWLHQYLSSLKFKKRRRKKQSIFSRKKKKNFM